MMSVRSGVCHSGDGSHFWQLSQGFFVAFWLQVRVAWAPADLCHQVGGQMPRDYPVGLKTLVMPWWRILVRGKRVEENEET